MSSGLKMDQIQLVWNNNPFLYDDDYKASVKIGKWGGGADSHVITVCWCP